MDPNGILCNPDVLNLDVIVGKLKEIGGSALPPPTGPVSLLCNQRSPVSQKPLRKPII